MGLWVLIQPIRFAILEEYGCQVTSFSYVIYFTAFAPQTVMSVASAVLAVLIFRVLMVHRRELNENLSSSTTTTPSRYNRLMLITCLDTISNFPIMLGGLLQDALVGSSGSANHPFVSWSNVHDGEAGLLPGDSLSTILQTPASEWSMNKWTVLNTKWNEWIYVVQAIIFFAVVGTTPEMGRVVRRMLCLSSKRSSESDSRSDEEGGGKIMSTVIFRVQTPAQIMSLGAFSRPNTDSLTSSDSVDTPSSEGGSVVKVEELGVEPSIDKSSGRDDSTSAVDLEKGI